MVKSEYGNNFPKELDFLCVLEYEEKTLRGLLSHSPLFMVPKVKLDYMFYLVRQDLPLGLPGLVGPRACPGWIGSVGGPNLAWGGLLPGSPPALDMLLKFFQGSAMSFPSLGHARQCCSCQNTNSGTAVLLPDVCYFTINVGCSFTCCDGFA
ncbi:hypothetical protein L3X38_037622 [Prunus dulcis]|uniref:Uncharacterized protein n=1 Tax=Prunus dulcis TaxID=3755 RepID=A0AAD4V3P4_PRUDU|nr:hypothetical protein L3X38_037622 [Prunus dulcis]